MHCAIIGAGAWGTAMVVHLRRLGHSVTLVTRQIDHALALNEERENQRYLPGVMLDADVQFACELQPALMEVEVVFLAVPGRAVRAVCEAVRSALTSARQLRAFIVLSKGLEPDSGLTSCAVVDDVLPEYPCAILAGPTFAGEIAAGQPAAVVLGSTMDDKALLEYLQQAFNHPLLRIYTSRDRTGIELGGCLKNVYAIAAGICDGLRLGDNAKAALLTRALAEMVRLGVALGGKLETFYGLSGFGDLMATCNGLWSRNRTFGQKVAEGAEPEKLIDIMTAEGYRSVKEFIQQCSKIGMDAPILREIHAVLYCGKPPSTALQALMARPLKHE